MEKRDSIFETLIAYIKGGKHTRLFIIIFVVSALLIIFGVFGSSEGAECVDEGLEARLEELCSSISGVGRCRIALNYQAEERKYSGDTEPRVESVVIVCKGAGSSRVRAELVELFTALYGIGANRIHIAPYK